MANERIQSSDAIKQLSSTFRSDSHKKFFGFTDLKLCSLEEKKSIFGSHMLNV